MQHARDRGHDRRLVASAHREVAHAHHGTIESDRRLATHFATQIGAVAVEPGGGAQHRETPRLIAHRATPAVADGSAFARVAHHGRNLRHGAIDSATMPVEHATRRLAQSLPPRRIGKQGEQLAPGLDRVLRLHEGAGLEEAARDVGKVRHRRTDDDRAGVARRLEDVVAPGRHQAAADEHDGRVRAERRELADRVEDEHVERRIRFRRRGLSGAPRAGRSARRAPSRRRSAPDAGAPGPAAPPGCSRAGRGRCRAGSRPPPSACWPRAARARRRDGQRRRPPRGARPLARRTSGCRSRSRGRRARRGSAAGRPWRPIARTADRTGAGPARASDRASGTAGSCGRRCGRSRAARRCRSARHRRTRFGQISVSTMTRTLGRRQRRTRRTIHAKSSGK